MAHVLLLFGAAAPAFAAAGSAAAVAAAVASAGGALVGGVCVVAGATAGIVFCTNELIDGLKGEFDLPTIVYTPYTIFSNKIPIFDINFFNPMKSVDEDGKTSETIHEIEKINDETEMTLMAITLMKDFIEQNLYEESLNKLRQEQKTAIEGLEVGDETSVVDEKVFIKRTGDEEYYISSVDRYTFMESDVDNAIELCLTLCLMYTNDDVPITISNINGYIKNAISNATASGEAKIEELFSSESSWAYYVVKNNGNYFLEKRPMSLVLKTSKEYESSASILSSPVASVYKTLRTVAIVALLTILVYVGIRMVLTSVAKEKTKYRNMLIDWFIALVLVFLLHYLMSFIIDISAKLTEIVDGSSIENIMLQIPNGTKVQNMDGELKRLDGGDEKSDFWTTNYIGVLRFYAGLVKNKGFTVKGITYTLMYVVVVIYMVIFTWQYLKRVLYMAFLTMIAPLVAITYPLDKLGDGKAQGFSLWLREYIFNALLQPIHCIIYVVIFGSVMQLVTDYPLYGLVALGFMVPAEKFIRKMFGFDKASTVGGFNAMAGTAALMGGLQKLGHMHTSRKESTENVFENAKLKENNENRGIKTIESIPNLDSMNSRDGTRTETQENNEISQKYNEDQFEKNASGWYFNPWIDEYDEDYDPHNDSSYNQKLESTNEAIDNAELKNNINTTKNGGFLNGVKSLGRILC